MDRLGCPTQIVITAVRYNPGSVKLRFKITLKLIPFKLRGFSVLCHEHIHVAHTKAHTAHYFALVSKNQLCSLFRGACTDVRF